PACVASYQPYYLDVARYAHGNKTANLLNNQTKSLRNLLTVLGLTRVTWYNTICRTCRNMKQIY
ncbi:MAG: hypothetical protein ACTTIF_01830, partial [Prevotella sp.]